MTDTLDSYRDGASPADEMVDEWLPPEFDWQRLVRRYPLAALGLAALGGWVLGRHRGDRILEAFANFAADTVSEQVNLTLGRDVL